MKKLGIMASAARKLAKAFKSEGRTYMVAGSGLVTVPEGRLNEIPRVIAEYHAKEAEKAKLLASVRRA